MSRSRFAAGIVVLAGLGFAFAASRPAEPIPQGDPLTVQLCDGQTSLSLQSTPATPEEGRAVAMSLMSAWLAADPSRTWSSSEPASNEPSAAAPAVENVEELKQRRYQIKPPFDNRNVLAEGQGAGHPYGNFAEKDVVIWERETRRLVVEGADVFHDANRLGSTIAVSCDMCHPDAANTHPETYPKFQTQIGRAVLLREMINWCIEHPVRGKKLAEDDPRMKALEAYIFAQRKGKELQYGRH